MDNRPEISRTPPKNSEAEQAVLGAILLKDDAIVDAMEYVSADDFYSRQHQILFKTMVALNDDDKPIDVVSMQVELNRRNQLEAVGGIQYLAKLAGAVPTAADVGFYAKIVHDKASLRNLIDTATKIVSESYEDNDDVADLLDRAEQSILNVAEDNNQAEMKNIETVVHDAANHTYELSKQQTRVTGLRTGYPQLDNMTTGLHEDELIILAARPAMGKTAFALNIAQNVAVRGDNQPTVAIFSLEMGAESLVNRMLCAEGGINANHLRTGNLDTDEWDALWVAMGSLAGTSIYIDDTAGIKVPEIRAKCRRLKKRTGNLSLVVIDYLQLIEGSNSENRQQEVSEISRQLKKLAKELSVPVIALSQLSRGVEQRQDKRPVMSDIRESGSIEQDADIVAFLYRDDYYTREQQEDGTPQPGSEQDAENSLSEVEVIIEKNRSGPRGTVKLLFNKAYNKFASVDFTPGQAPE
ncbi:MAG: replicative DNA helicase [Limosilactobacillus gorillae]|jgi:replicative DNA helicase|uniref:replicative DNA helicase n=1 Tax=Limosilactobacillus gorillae TaxID=1450649 RepID=UPI000ACC8987|nr:replicative DNA helicase [Limosilactobacillus gorillae]MDO4855601.1 replicative DNA helicase [Limosilactobacillus gorillae]